MALVGWGEAVACNFPVMGWSLVGRRGGGGRRGGMLEAGLGSSAWASSLGHVRRDGL
jgi:hypothetical protein